MALRIRCEGHIEQLSTPKIREHRSEHPPKLEEPFVMAGVAYASPYKQWTNHRFGQDTGGNIIREFAFVCSAVHFCEFVRSNYKHSFPHERRQDPQVVQIACPEQVVLIALQLIQAVSAESQR